jgi:hypothetical protein
LRGVPIEMISSARQHQRISKGEQDEVVEREPGNEDPTNEKKDST